MRRMRQRRPAAVRAILLTGVIAALAFVIVFVTSATAGKPARAETNVTLTVDAGQQVYPFKDTIRGVATNNWSWLWSGLWDRGSGYQCCPAGKRDAIIDATSYIEPGIIRFAGGLWANKVGWDRNGQTSGDNDSWQWTNPDTNAEFPFTYTHVYKPAMVDSFQDFRTQLGAKAIIQVNVCDNNPEMWADLVRYSNIEHNYGFEYWEIGNEQTLDSCGLNAMSYAQRYATYQAALKAVDPSIKVLGPIAHQPTFENWEEALVDEMGADLDVLAWHWYQLTEWNSNPTSFAFQGGSVDAMLAWGGNVGTVSQDGFGSPGNPNSIADGNLDRWTYRRGIAEQKMDYVKDHFRSSDPTLETAITEFGVQASAHTHPINGNHLAAIWLADMLGRWAYNGLDIITYYSLEDGTTGPGENHSRGLLGIENSSRLDVRPTYYTEYLYAQHFGDMMVQSDTSDPEKKVVVWASTDSDDPGKLKLMLVNLSDDTANAQIEINGFNPSVGRAYVMTSTDPVGDGNALTPSDTSSFNEHTTTINGVKIPDYQISDPSVFQNAINSISPVGVAVSNDFSYSLPAYSVVALELDSSGTPLPTATATSTPVVPTATAVPTQAPTSTPVQPTSTPIVSAESGNWPDKIDLSIGESHSFTLENGQTRTITLVDYDIVIPRQKVMATVRVEGGGKSSTHTLQVVHAGVPVAANGVWLYGYAWDEADDNDFESVGRQGGFPLTSGKAVGFAVNDAAYPFYPDLDGYTYPIDGAAFHEGIFLQTWLDPDGWAHSGFDIGVNNVQQVVAVTDGYVWAQWYGEQGQIWITPTNDEWSSTCWVFTHIENGSLLVAPGTFVAKGTPLATVNGAAPSTHTHMGSCNSFDFGSWLFAASIWNNEHQSDYPAPRYWLGLGAYSGDINTNRIASNESGDLPASFAPKAGDSDINGGEEWKVTDNFVNSVVRVGEVLSDSPFSGYSDRDGENSMGYLATYIYSPTDYTSSSAAHLKFGASRGARVWLNGDKIHDATESRYNSFNANTEPALVIDKYDYVLPLKQGWNLLVIKSDNGSRNDGLWAVSPKIGTSAGNRIPGLIFSVRDTALSASGANNSISLNWSAVDSAGAFVDSYKVDVATDAGFQNIVRTADVAGSSTSTIVSGLGGSQTYYVRLRPFNASELGGSTYWQHTDSVTVQTSGSGTPVPQPTQQPTSTPSSGGTDSLAPSQSPPGGLDPSEVPMFVLLGSDDNNRAGGVEFFVNAMHGRTNPDGTPALMTFFLIGTNIFGPNIDSQQWRDQYLAAYNDGHEIGNHGFYGLANDAPHSTVDEWINNWIKPTHDALLQLGIAPEDIRGYRAAQDVLNPAMYEALEQLGYEYAGSSVTNYSTNQPAWWTGTLENGWPGGAPWDDRDFGSHTGFWEIPQTYAKDSSKYCDKDWFSPPTSGTGQDWKEAMQETFLQLYNGNRAPMSICLHSQEWGPTNTLASGGTEELTASTLERQQAMNEFLDWLLSGQFPEVRLISHGQLIDWMKNPVALDGSTPLPTATATPTQTPPAGSSPTATPTQAPAGQPQIVFSTNSNRSNPAQLNGKTVNGDIFVWTNPDSNSWRAVFYLDDPSRSDAPLRTENVPPFDIAGTNDSNGNSNAFHTSQLSNGNHNITAVVSLTAGGQVVLSANFTVQNGGSPQPTATSSPNPTATATPTTVPPTSAPPPPAGGGGGGGFVPLPTATSTPLGPVPPGAPQRVTATARDGKITLEVVQPVSNGGAPVTGYRVLALPTTDLFFIDRAIDGDTYVIDSLAGGIEYQFQVRAINAAGLSTSFTLSNTVLLDLDVTPTTLPSTSGSPDDEPEPTSTSTPVPTAEPTATATPTVTPSPIPTATAQPTATPGSQDGPDAVSIDLDKGWNLVSFQVLPEDRSVQNVFATISGMYTEVNTISGSEVLVYSPGGSTNTLATISPSVGYWVKMKDAATLTVGGYSVERTTIMQLQEGWNLVPYLIDETWPVRLALSSIAGKYDEVRGFDGEAMSFFPALPSAFNTLTEMMPGEAYLIHMTEPGQLIYP